MSGFENERETPDYDIIMHEVQNIFTENREITLATSYTDRVTSRTVSFVNKDLRIYFISWEHNKKIQQIIKNPRVALTLLNIQIEGSAKVLGKPTDFQDVGDLFRAKFSDRWFDAFSHIKEMVLVEIEIDYLVKFENINRRFHLQNIDLVNKVVHQMRLEDTDHPFYPY